MTELSQSRASSHQPQTTAGQLPRSALLGRQQSHTGVDQATRCFSWPPPARLQFHPEPCQPPGFGGCHGQADPAPHRPQPQVLSVIWKQEDLLKSAKGHCPRHRALPTTTRLCLWVLPSHLPGLGPWCLCPWALRSIRPSDLTTAKPVLPSSHQFPNTEPRTSRSSHPRSGIS